MREPEGGRKPTTRKVPGKAQVKTPRTRHSQRRGRGFESLHLHSAKRPRSERVGDWGSPEGHEASRALRESS